MAHPPLERQIMEHLNKLSDAQKRQVFEFVITLQQSPRLTAREILRLPSEERQRLVAAAFEAAADEDFETFEAYSEESPDG